MERLYLTMSWSGVLGAMTNAQIKLYLEALRQEFGEYGAPRRLSAFPKSFEDLPASQRYV